MTDVMNITPQNNQVNNNEASKSKESSSDSEFSFASIISRNFAGQ